MIRRNHRGISLLEAILMVVVLGIVSLGFGIALQSNVRIPSAVDQRLTIHTFLVEKMEDLMSQSFATLAANSGLTDTVTVNGQTLTRTVTVAQADADGNGTVDSDFLEITVTIGGQSLKTRVTQP